MAGGGRRQLEGNAVDSTITDIGTGRGKGEEEEGVMSSAEAGVARQYSSGGYSCVALPTRTDVAGETETEGETVIARRRQIWRCRMWRELGLEAAHLAEAAEEAA